MKSFNPSEIDQSKKRLFDYKKTYLSKETELRNTIFGHMHSRGEELSDSYDSLIPKSKTTTNSTCRKRKYSSDQQNETIDCSARRVCPINSHFYHAKNIQKRNLNIGLQKQIDETNEQKLQELKMNDFDQSTSKEDLGYNSSLINSKAILPNDNININTVKINLMNTRITKTMQKIYQMIMENGPRIHHPSSEILILVNWNYLIKVWNENMVNIYEIFNYNSPSSCKTMIISNKYNIDNVKKMVKYDHIVDLRHFKNSARITSLLCKMLVHSVEKLSTCSLVLLLHGYTNFWLVDGFLRTNSPLSSSFKSQPTPDSHPRINQKIALYYELLTRINCNMKEGKKKISETMYFRNNKAFTNVNVPIRESCSSASNNPASIFLEENELLSPYIYSEISTASNIEVKPINPVKGKMPLRSAKYDCYIALTLVNDFSDLYVPSWNKFISYDKIMQTIQIAQTNCDIVEVTSSHRLVCNQDQRRIKLYAIPGIFNRIYLGPYPEQCDTGLLLYQSVDDKLILREEYLENNNVTREDKTTASWIYVATGAITLHSFDLEI